MKCKNCGAEFDGKFCPYCGEKQVEDTTNGNESSVKNIDIQPKSKAKKPIYKKWWFWVIAVLLLFGIIGSFGEDSSDNDASEFNWSDMTLGSMLPTPESNSGKNLINTEDYLSIDILDVSPEEYKEYVSGCREKGFIVEVSEYDTYFDAKNADGYELMLYYFESDEEMSIDLNAPSKSDSNKNENEKETASSNNSTDETTDPSERTYEVVREFLKLYNEKLEPDIINTEEFITEDRILKYDEAYAIQGDVDGEYILIMNFGSWDIKDEMRIEMYVNTPDEVFELISNVSKAINKPLTEDESDKTKKYLNECFTDEYQQYTEWTDVNSIRFWAGYNGIGDNYEVLIEFSIDNFYK